MRKPNKRKLIMLGAGAYEGELNGEEKPSRKNAQGDFMEAVRRLVPEVLEDLGQEPFRLYVQIPEFCLRANKYFEKGLDELTPHQRFNARFYWERYQRIQWENIEKDSAKGHENRLIAAFRAALIQWSRRNNLDEVWCRERAYNTLEDWSAEPESYKQLQWKFQINYPHPFIAGGEPRFQFERRTHYPLFHSRREDFELANEEFKRQYGKFQDDLEATMEASGYTPAPSKPPNYHFDWLVRYHVQEWNYSTIATSHKIDDESHLRHRVPELARLIGLELKNRRGRPRKS